jgi:hypothetical protein
VRHHVGGVSQLDTHQDDLDDDTRLRQLGGGTWDPACWGAGTAEHATPADLLSSPSYPHRHRILRFILFIVIFILLILVFDITFAESSFFVLFCFLVCSSALSIRLGTASRQDFSFMSCIY